MLKKKTATKESGSKYLCTKSPAKYDTDITDKRKAPSGIFIQLLNDFILPL